MPGYARTSATWMRRATTSDTPRAQGRTASLEDVAGSLVVEAMDCTWTATPACPVIDTREVRGSPSHGDWDEGLDAAS